MSCFKVPGSVAVNKKVLLALGISLMIWSKPSFSAVTISSASSKTKYFIFFISIASRFTKSANLPGVATTMCVASFKRSIWGFIGIPPQIVAIEISGAYFANEVRFAEICCPSSLVGAKIIA